ncbi:uncharacterized protein TNCV_1741151 [Trichonephila clavipes]|uniref:Uncharacterized protein n=1 Tax=Trichonephila clavipes TaxID=2585209 RepID=A0A8X6RCM4_TRICX|nr:uncharacterized protein TNCV_1741151 [Trichonephila clavipes]
MNDRSMLLPLNSFHGYGVIKMGINLECDMWQCSSVFSDDYPFQRQSFTVFQFRVSPVVLHKRNLTQNHDVQELWFQQDSATCHTARATIDLLKDTFGDRLISRFGPVNWPPGSCDLTPLDYFLWGYVK